MGINGGMRKVKYRRQKNNRVGKGAPDRQRERGRLAVAAKMIFMIAVHFANNI